MKKAVVTGCTGFIGNALTLKLLDHGVFVYGVGRNHEKMSKLQKYPNFKPIFAEFDDYSNLDKTISDKDIDVFFHLAWAGGFTSAIRDYKCQMMNAAYSGDALNAAINMHAKKFVYSGTYNEYEIQTWMNSEYFEPRYTCIYSTGKIAADLICRTLAWNRKIDYCSALIPMPYGENNYSRQLANVLFDSFNKGIRPKLVEGNNLYDFVYIDDIAGALEAIGEKGKNQQSYYIGHRKLITLKEWVEKIRDILAPDMKLRFGEYHDNQNIDYSLIDLDALYRDTGFECTADFSKTIKKTAEWVKNLNW